MLQAALSKDPEQRPSAGSLSSWLKRLETAHNTRSSVLRADLAGAGDFWSSRLARVQHVEYWPDEEGRIQIRGSVTRAAEDQPAFSPLLPPPPRVGDLVGPRPNQRWSRLFEGEYTVYFPGDGEPEPPLDTCTCTGGLLPLAGNWRERSSHRQMPADESLDEYRSFCPGAGHCLWQDQAWWFRLLALYMPREVVQAMLGVSVFSDPGRLGLLRDASILEGIFPDPPGLADRAVQSSVRFARAAGNSIHDFLDACGMPGSGRQGAAGKALRDGAPGLSELLRRDSPWGPVEAPDQARAWWEDRSWRILPIAGVLAELVEQHGPGDGSDRLVVPDGTWWLTTGYGFPK